MKQNPGGDYRNVDSGELVEKGDSGVYPKGKFGGTAPKPSLPDEVEAWQKKHWGTISCQGNKELLAILDKHRGIK